MSTPEITYSTPTAYGQRSLDECINIAFSIHAGHGFASAFRAGPTGPSAHCAPSFPAATAVVFSIFGTNEAGGVARDLVNVAGYSLLFALFPAFAMRLGITASAGVVSGLAAALYPWYGLAEITRGRDEWLAAITGMVLLLSALQLARKQDLSGRPALLYGAGWGALMYVLPSVITVLPV